MSARADYFSSDLYRDPSGEIVTDLVATLENQRFSGYSPQGISSYLMFRYPVLANTMFAGFGSIPPGCEVDGHQFRPYWRPCLDPIDAQFDQALDRCEELLVAAVADLLAGRQVIGFTLSGGIDSSLLVAIAKRHFPERTLLTYSCGFYGDDEFEYSRKVAGLYGDHHTEIVLGRDDFVGEQSILAALIRHKGAPLHPNELPLATIEGAASQDGCEIVLNGEGADDIFGGYGRNLRMYLNYEGPNCDYYKHILDEYRYFSRAEAAALIRPEYLIDDEQLVQAVFAEPECPQDPRDQMFYFIQRLHTPGLIERARNALSFNGMAGGFPFIDEPLVNYVNSLPFDFKVHWNRGVDVEQMRAMDYKTVSEVYDTPKYILKKLAERYLPSDIIYRKKYGFPVPFDSWFADVADLHLDDRVFLADDVSQLSGWKKFMVWNLNSFISVFNTYQGE